MFAIKIIGIAAVVIVLVGIFIVVSTVIYVRTNKIKDLRSSYSRPEGHGKFYSAFKKLVDKLKPFFVFDRKQEPFESVHPEHSYPAEFIPQLSESNGSDGDGGYAAAEASANADDLPDSISVTVSQIRFGIPTNSKKYTLVKSSLSRGDGSSILEIGRGGSEVFKNSHAHYEISEASNTIAHCQCVLLYSDQGVMAINMNRLGCNTYINNNPVKDGTVVDAGTVICLGAEEKYFVKVDYCLA